MTIRNFAMTYPQFMSQAIEFGKSEQDLVYLRKAYKTAERLFDGIYRGQHVPFICHVVRTASILLAEQASIEVIAAGLLHAAYAVGCFSDFCHGKATTEHRSEIERELGKSVELLVFDYNQFLWYQKECVQDHADQLESYGDHEKNLILMRLANDLEDYLDLGMVYRGAFPYRAKIEAYGDKAVELARRLQRFQLAEELQRAFDVHLNADLPAAVLTNQKLSYQLPALKWLKKSYFEKLQVKGKQFFQKLGRSKENQIKEFVSGKN